MLYYETQEYNVPVLDFPDKFLMYLWVVNKYQIEIGQHISITYFVEVRVWQHFNSRASKAVVDFSPIPQGWAEVFRQNFNN